MSGDQGTLGRLAARLVGTVRPLEEAFSDEDAFRVLLLQLGWEADGLPASYLAVADTVAQAVAALERLTDGATTEEIVAVIGKAGDVYRAINALTDAPAGIDPAAFLPELGRRLFEYLLGRELMSEARDWFAAFEALGVVALEAHPATATRPDFVRVRFDWDQIPAILSDPSLIPARIYGWGTPDLDFRKIVELVTELAGGMGLPASLDILTDEQVAPLHDGATPRDIANLGMTVTAAQVPLPDGTTRPVGVRVTGLPAEDGRLPGMIVLPVLPSGLDANVPLGGDWSLRVRAKTDLANQLGVFARPGELGVRYPGAPGQPLPSAGFGVSLVFAPPSPVRLFGEEGQTRLELSGMTVSASVDLREGRPEVSVTVGVTGLALVINTEGADGFLATVLGSGESRVEIPAELSWSSRTGLRLATRAGLEVSTDLNLDLGFIHVNRALFALVLDTGAPALVARAAASFSGSLGPFTFVVDRFGVELPVAFRPGNAGPFDVSLRIAPPTAVGLALDAGAFAGGGFLGFDPERGEYTGVLELEFANFVQLKAIGLISTRQPDGSRGFSLLLVLTAEFGSGIQLGYGFTLLGVGGLMGLNRGMNLQALVEGVRTGAIESVAFPRDVIANAPRILSDLSRFFPPREGTFLIGPMAKIGWGTPTLISISLGLIIEIPGDIAILGVLRAALPSADDALLLLQVQFLGALELDKSRLWFVAQLFLSRVLSMTLEGGMGLLVAWGDNPDLVISVGGFHPDYRPPPLPFDVPARMAVNLLNRSNALIRATGYFAITSNTVQFGAGIELRLGFDDFGIEGNLAFDALFRFSPFAFSVRINGDVTLKAFGVGAFTIHLDFRLEGPAPWRAHGRGSIGFLFFSISADFDIIWGDAVATVLPPVQVLPLLAAEIAKPEGWETRLPSGGNRSMVSLRPLPDTDDLVLHPLGTLFVRQRALPLGVRVDRVGAQRAADGRRFTVSPVQDTGLEAVSVTGDKFAMAQFQDMPDDQRLSRPSYETQDAGLELTAEKGALAAPRVVRRAARYELHIVDGTPAPAPALAQVRRAAVPVKRFHDVDSAVFGELLRGSSTSRAPLSRREETLRQPFTADDTVRVAAQRFVVAYTRSNRQAFPPGTLTLGDRPAAATFRSRTTAEDALAEYVTADPTLDGRLHVIPATEAAASPAVPGTWSAAGVLPVPVSGAELVRLANGKVLLAGGESPSGTAVAATALFDPTGDVWSPGPAMTAARRGHTTTRLVDGRVLVAGGLDAGGRALGSAEVFDPAAGTWTPAPAPMITPRHGHTATLLPKGRVLIAGGTGARGEQEPGSLTSAEIFDPATRTWTAAEPMTDARTGHQTVPLQDGKVLVTGGSLLTGGTRADALAYCEFYDPNTGLWIPTGSLAIPRAGHQATLLPDGRVLVTGGEAVVAPDGTLDPHSLDGAELYDPKTRKWTRAAPMPDGGRTRHRALFTAGAVLVIGGTGGPEHTAGHRSALAYILKSGTWTAVGALNLGRADSGIVQLADNRVLTAGGITGAGAAASGADASDPAATGEVLIP
ncbi:DUF6603 domain-containing protein [Nonomuraea insulae]|uniref:DUF6603 domain-containing protein n=1 Tax=Nonomuraea insulae TaxID=1616787 RepID=A0ABW1CZ85_9ACTN